MPFNVRVAAVSSLAARGRCSSFKQKESPEEGRRCLHLTLNPSECKTAMTLCVCVCVCVLVSHAIGSAEERRAAL